MSEDVPATKVTTAVDEGVLVVTLSRPEILNAIDTESWEGLLSALDRAEQDRDLGAVVITGAGSAFSSGADMKTVGTDVRPGVYGHQHRLLLAQQSVRRIRASRLPVLAAVPGPAVGVGWSIALACDMLIASRSAYFLAPFLDRGRIPDGGALWLLAESIGRHRATALALTRARVGAEQARELGFVHEVVEDGAALDVALALARDLAAGPTETISQLKGLLRRAPGQTLDQYLELERDAVVLNRASGNPAEGVAAWKERRPPAFS
ncbi:enoyl-CoA hydratase/isomerase family protein [Streptomyces sp. CA-100214]